MIGEREARDKGSSLYPAVGEAPRPLALGVKRNDPGQSSLPFSTAISLSFEWRFAGVRARLRGPLVPLERDTQSQESAEGQGPSGARPGLGQAEPSQVRARAGAGAFAPQRKEKNSALAEGGQKNEAEKSDQLSGPPQAAARRLATRFDHLWDTVNPQGETCGLCLEPDSNTSEVHHGVLIATATRGGLDRGGGAAEGPLEEHRINNLGYPPTTTNQN
ncbi:hypothetical protein JZ751_015644 [Albula glossodonta]|uniref:Uncharacterized protein n=1 Tax=Albula glossodonta TaxID=121402 RepID=A0A8T2NZE2_9TELE|nr:hypothetical protein JZ751_015644 [Albula glossodonta]